MNWIELNWIELNWIEYMRIPAGCWSEAEYSLRLTTDSARTETQETEDKVKKSLCVEWERQLLHGGYALTFFQCIGQRPVFLAVIERQVSKLHMVKKEEGKKNPCMCNLLSCLSLVSPWYIYNLCGPFLFAFYSLLKSSSRLWWYRWGDWWLPSDMPAHSFGISHMEHTCLKNVLVFLLCHQI